MWAVKLVKVITGEEPRVTPMPDGVFSIRGTGRHIYAQARYEELRKAIEEWSNQRRGGNRCGHGQRNREFDTSNHSGG